MFETAELGRTLDKTEFKQQVPALRTEMLKLQREVEARGLPVIVLVAGVEGSGRGDAINLINEWMDTRNIITHAFDVPTEEERHRPEYWRYWMATPPKGSIAVITGAWYLRSILERIHGKGDDADLGRALVRIQDFERALTDSGTLLIKLWMHISKKDQKKRFKKLRADPRTAWRVTERDLEHAERYDELRSVYSRVVRETSTGNAPWYVIESGDRRFRDVAIARQICDRIQRRLDEPAADKRTEPPGPIDDPDTILDTIDLSKSIEREVYRERLATEQGRLYELSRRVREEGVGTILVFEGADAAGKGGCIRRIIGPLDARQYRVIPIAAPTDEEKAHHYLWRFWRHLPRLGRFTIYDRSWYGRVLVERVEAFARQAEWMRAYKEINEFEEQLIDHGIALVKFWLHISPEEQLRRFEEREATPWKQYKITQEDYRNRDKANLYEMAASDMIERTSTELSPWHLVPSEDKRYARVKVLETVNEAIERALARRNAKANGAKPDKKKSRKEKKRKK